MRKLAHLVLFGILAAGLAACDDTDGDGIPDDGNAPLAEVKGMIQGPGGIAYTSPHVGIVWVNWGDGSSYAPDFIEQVTAIDATQMPVSFGLSVFQPPPASAYNVIYDWSTGAELGRMAMAFVVALEDVNGDGSFVIDANGIASPDLLFGVSWSDALIHLGGTLDPTTAAQMFSNPAAATAGFHVAHFDYCTGLMEIVDNGTFSIRTFPAASSFPEEGAEEYPDCEWPEPGTGPGTGPCADPEGETCWECLDDALTECLTVTCGAANDALTACATAAGCDPNAIDGGRACVLDNCLDEMNALEACMYTCDGWEACYGEPVEG